MIYKGIDKAKDELMQGEFPIEIWGGIECTINRVRSRYHDQLEYSGHYTREGDIELIAKLGIKKLRYPVLWEKHQPKFGPIDWSFAAKNLGQLHSVGVTPIVGLVHHGSGPKHVHFLDGSFEDGLANYAREVAMRFPHLAHYTPVNEPLTTARFCGLYGHWFPHSKNEHHFFKILLSECRATILAMKEIRKINPAAQLIQTEDLGKCHSTPLLSYQAELENERRWLSYDLLCGTLTPEKPMWEQLINAGIQESELHFFLDNPCAPDIAGFNYYRTSERYLDEQIGQYERHYRGGNHLHRYADVEAGRATCPIGVGVSTLLSEAWSRLQLPIAITECHLHGTPEERLAWFDGVYDALRQVRASGADVRAITAWAMFGLFGWNRLVTKPWGHYEPGVFELNNGELKPTEMALHLQRLTRRHDRPIRDNNYITS